MLQQSNKETIHQIPVY